jgi:glycosyltransferase involved in cell wall biosynthesis
MVIAAHILAASTSNGILLECLQALALKKREVKFVLFVDEEAQRNIRLTGNVQTIIVKPATKNGLMLHYWYRFKLAKQLRKYAVDIFISDSGAFSPSLSIPYLMWVNDISFFDKKKSTNAPFTGFLRRYFSHAIAGAVRVLTPQSFLKTSLEIKFPSYVSKICVIPHGISGSYNPMDEHEQEHYRESVSGSIPYFIFVADQYSAPQLTMALKAFSLFKKRQKSSMKLLVLLHDVSIDTYVKDFHLYKYRADVIIKTFVDEISNAQMLAAAYAGIYLPSYVDIVQTMGLNILKSGIPLITVQFPAALELYEEAALYSNLHEKDIADHMMDLYKDEEKRKNLIELGIALVNPYNWENSTEQLWQTILWHASFKAH